MALKTDRSTLQTDISFFANAAATRGGVVSLSTAGSGASRCTPVGPAWERWWTTRLGRRESAAWGHGRFWRPNWPKRPRPAYG